LVVYNRNLYHVISIKHSLPKSPPMKTTLLLLLCFLSFTASKAQSTALTGTWTMFEYSWTNDQGNQTTTEDQIKADGGVTEYLFTDDGNFKLTSNMADESTGMTTYEGTWKFEEDKLMLKIKMDEQLVDVVWNAEIKDNILNLSRSSPDGSIKVVNSFRRK
jgi:hypothetical protein